MSGKGNPVGKKAMDGLRRHFVGTGNKERGDFYLDRSFILLHQRCFGSIEKDYIGKMYIRLVQNAEA
jgi:hypothetical protein